MSPGEDVSCTADDFVSGIKSVALGWGVRSEHLSCLGFFALLHRFNSTFLDTSDFLQRKSEDSQRLQRVIVESPDNVTARGSWKYDFNRCENAALNPPKHKLSKLLLSGTRSPAARTSLNTLVFEQCPSWTW